MAARERTWRKKRDGGDSHRVTQEPRRARDEDAETMVQLKKFVKEMQKSRGRAVEMRLAILTSIGIGLRGFFYTDKIIENTSATHNVFYFMLFTILIIILTTWLDYFPSRLESIQMRPAGGQGLPLSCLLPPMICVALLCYVADHKPEYIDIMSFYLALTCTVSIATIIPTLIYSIPFPNSIVIYNFVLLLLIFCVNSILEVPVFPLLFLCILYSILVPFLLHSFPESFTLGEASLVSHGVALLMTDTCLMFAHKMGWYELPSSLAIERDQSLLFLEMCVTGFVLCCFLFSICLYKLALIDDSRDQFYAHIWSLAFLQLCFLFAFFVVIPSLKMFISESPVVWLLKFLLQNKQRVLIVLYWMIAVGVAGVIVMAQSFNWRILSVFKSDNPSSLWMRKWFHLLALAVYVPGIVLDPLLLKVSSALVTVAFIVIELIRLFRIWPLGYTLHRLLLPFTDSRDSGDLILTHTYLLIGFSLPVWFFPLKDVTTVAKLSMFAGVLSLGVGDSIAAVSGTLIGRHKWPGTNKTFEGSFLSILCQLVVAYLIIVCDKSIPALSQYSWLILVASIVLGVAMEAYTHQIDNLILGGFQFAICVAFL